MFADFAAKFLETDAQRHRGATAGLVAGDLQHLAHEAHPVFKRAAVTVVTVVVFRQQELVAKVTHAGVHVENIEAGVECSPRGQSLPVQHLVDVGPGHFFGSQLAHETHMCCRP